MPFLDTWHQKMRFFGEKWLFSTNMLDSGQNSLKTPHINRRSLRSAIWTDLSRSENWRIWSSFCSFFTQKFSLNTIVGDITSHPVIFGRFFKPTTSYPPTGGGKKVKRGLRIQRSAFHWCCSFLLAGRRVYVLHRVERVWLLFEDLDRASLQAPSSHGACNHANLLNVSEVT